MRIVYSPLDAVTIAAANPGRQVVFFAIGFETTAPAKRHGGVDGEATRLDELQRSGLARPGAAGDDGHPRRSRQPRAGLPRSRPRLHGGWLRGVRTDRARATASRSSSPDSSRWTCSRGCYQAVRQLEAGRAEVENAYGRAVRREGNPASRALIDEVFEVCDRKWRGVGEIPRSGLRLRAAYHAFDAERRFDVSTHRDAGVERLHQRRHPARRQEAARLSRVWHGVHADDAAWRDDGVGRRGMRRVLRLRPAPAGRADDRPMASDMPTRVSVADLLGSCPMPFAQYDRVLLGHGSGGRLSADLVHRLFLPAFQNEVLSRLEDQAVCSLAPHSNTRIAFTTDSFVVRPIFFPGGDIGRLAVHGTVNDLAVGGAIAALYQRRLHPGRRTPDRRSETRGHLDAPSLRRGRRHVGHRRHEGRGPGQRRSDLHHHVGHRRRAAGSFAFGLRLPSWRPHPGVGHHRRPWHRDHVRPRGARIRDHARE